MTAEEMEKRDRELREVLGSEETTRLLTFAQQIFQRLQLHSNQDQHNNNDNNVLDKKNEENLRREDIKTFKDSVRVPRELRLVLRPTTSKEERTRIHQLIKTYFPYLQSETKSQKITDPSTAITSFHSILFHFIHNL
jgi:hypothetical protein